jgi:hypothetical protein
MFHSPRNWDVIQCMTNITKATFTIALLFVSSCNHTKSYCTQFLEVFMIHANTPPVGKVLITTKWNTRQCKTCKCAQMWSCKFDQNRARVKSDAKFERSHFSQQHVEQLGFNNPTAIGHMCISTSSTHNQFWPKSGEFTICRCFEHFNEHCAEGWKYFGGYVKLILIFLSPKIG